MAEAGCAGSREKSKRRETLNFALLLLMFIIYALVFTIAKFYDYYNVVYPCAGITNFCILVVLLFNNVNVAAAVRNKDSELYILAALILITGIDLIVVHSGKGAFFVPVNFLLIWYMSDKLYLSGRLMTVLAGLYTGFLLFYLFIAYPRLFTTFENYKYNTNTAATFTIYTLLCAFILLEIFYDRSKIVGLFMVTLLLKGFQLSLWHRARGAFIMLVMFMIFRFVVPEKWWSIKPLYILLCIMATFGSLVFVGLYVVVGATGANFRMPFFYKEVFSGREQIWYELFLKLVDRKHPYMLFTGIGTNFELESFFEKNVHNAMYNFVVIHGIIVFAGIIYFIFKRLMKLRTNIIHSRVALCAMCVIMAVFFESYFDVDLIWADYALNLIYLLLFTGNYEEED